MAGTLIMRFLWPRLHFLPSSMYCFVRSATGSVAVTSSSSGSSSKLT